MRRRSGIPVLAEISQGRGVLGDSVQKDGQYLYLIARRSPLEEGAYGSEGRRTTQDSWLRAVGSSRTDRKQVDGSGSEGDGGSVVEEEDTVGYRDEVSLG